MNNTPLPYTILTVYYTLSFIHTKKQPLNDCLSLSIS
nr:MAG TPA: hypothetical protein [Caudoviricetes sp.]